MLQIWLKKVFQTLLISKIFDKPSNETKILNKNQDISLISRDIRIFIKSKPLPR